MAYGETKLGAMVPLDTCNFFTDIRRPAIRSSPLSCFDECPRKFLYIYRLGIQPRSYRAPLFMGSLVHKVLQCLFLGQSKEEALGAARSLLQKEQDKVLKLSNEAGFLPGGKDIGGTLRSMEEDFYKAQAMALSFWHFTPFNTHDWEILRTPDGDPMVEMKMEVELPRLRKVIAPCDLALVKRWKDGYPTKEVWIVDFKTTSYDPKMLAIPTRFSPQIRLYRLALQTLLKKWWPDQGQTPIVKGAYHAIIKKPTIKYCPDTKDRAGFMSYVGRMVKWYQDQEKKDPQNPPLLLDPQAFGGPVLDQEFRGRLEQYGAAAQTSPDIHDFYRAGGSACFKYNKPCPYAPLCNSAPAMWPSLVRDQYEISFREDEEE